MELGFAFANVRMPEHSLKQIYLTHDMPLLSQLDFNYNLSPDVAKTDPGYQYLVNYLGQEDDIDEYIEFLKSTIIFYRDSGALTVGVNNLLTKTHFLDNSDSEK